MSVHIPEHLIDDIRLRADIVDIASTYLSLKKRGRDYWACCPFHREKTPSFKVSSENQLFYCFGCKKSGNVFHLIEGLENVDFIGAVRLLAGRVGVQLPEESVPLPSAKGEDSGGRADKSTILELLERIAQWYRHLLGDPRGQTARDYIEERGLDAGTVKKFGLGYSLDEWGEAISWAERHGYDRRIMAAAGMIVIKDEQQDRAYDRFRGRLMFPVHDPLGRIVGFSARTLEPEAETAKYINSPESAVFRKSRLLYCLHMGRNCFTDHGGALICEGQLDVIACHRAGLTNAISAQGTAFTEDHARVLKRYTDCATLAFDADEAGQKATVRAVRVLQSAGFTVRVISLPAGEDPDSILAEDGRDALRERFSDSRDALEFVLELARSGHDESSTGGKDAIANRVLEVIETLSSPIKRASACQWLSDQLRLPENAVMDSLSLLMKKRKRRGRGRRRGPVDTPAASSSGTGRPGAIAALPGGSPVERTQAALLDLALQSERLACAMVEQLPRELISDSPTGRALDLVVGMAAQGEWSDARAGLAADHELVSDSCLGQILVHSSFGSLFPGEVKKSEEEEVAERRTAAMNDCLKKLELLKLNENLRQVQRQLAEVSDPEQQLELHRKLQEMTRRKYQLR